MKTKRFKVSNFSGRPALIVESTIEAVQSVRWHLPVFQFDVASLVPLELFYFKTGINPLLRLPRLLKVRFITVHSMFPLNNTSQPVNSISILPTNTLRILLLF